MKRVFIFDGRSRAALQIVRSLGDKGFKIFIGNESNVCSSFFSRYVYKRFEYPNPKTEKFKNFVFNLIKKYEFDVIIPVRDDTTLFCARYYKELSKYTNLLISDYNTIIYGRDKAKTFSLAKKYDVPIPKTKIITHKEKLISYTGQFPIVLKPAFSSGSRGLYIVNNKKALLRITDTIFQNYNKYLLQDYIPSNITEGVNVIFDKEGNLGAAFSYKRVREYPRNGGPSVLRESTCNKELIDICVNFLKKIKWCGVAMLEFKIDSRDNIPKLMEINPRFWGSLALPIYAGIDFPYILYKFAKNEKIKPIYDYKVGVQARWLFMGDFLWLMNSKNILKDLKKFLIFKKENMTYDIFSIRDFGPTIGAILEGFMYLIDKKKRKHVFSRGNKLN